MRAIIRTGILGGVTFAALALGVERDADACNTDPPEEECSITVEDEYTYYADNTVSTATPAGANCGCAEAFGDAPEDVTLVAAGIFNLVGQPSQAFCGGGSNPATTAAFQLALGGVTWQNSVLNAISAFGVTSGNPGFAIYKFHTPTTALGGELGLAQVNVAADGTLSVDPTHQTVKTIDLSKCVDCNATPFARPCIATATARQYLDFTTLAAKVACAKTDVPALLGLTRDEPEEGGCSTSGTAGLASGLLLGLVGIALTIARRRRRA